MKYPYYDAKYLEKYFRQNRNKYQLNFDPFDGSWCEQHGDTAGVGTLFECLEWSSHRVGRAKASITDVLVECLENGTSSGGNEDDASDWFISLDDFSEDLSNGGAA